MQNQTSNLHQSRAVTTGSSTVDSFGHSISKKSERLATALYLVTSFLSDNEPLKFRLRELSLDLVQKSGSVRYGSFVSDRTLFEDTQRSITETLSLLELAFIAGIISEMNFTILKREYASLRDAIEIKKVSRESRTDTILGDTFFGSTFNSKPIQNSKFNIQHSTPTPIQNSKFNIQPSATHTPIGHSKGQTNIKMSDRTPPAPIQNSKFNIQNSTPTPIRNSIFDIQSSVTLSPRSTRILKLIKDNREVSIKDIATHFPELSEKTIQRELVSLTETNVLKKSGDRRWSRYALA